MWDHVGRVIAEYPHLETLALDHTQIIGQENLQNALNNPNGAIFFGAHLGNWEINGAAVLLLVRAGEKLEANDAAGAEALLKAAGLKRTAFGVESGDPEILKSIDKKVDHDTIRWAFQNAKDVGLETIAFLIIGLPGETRETMQRTIDFAIELDPLIANFSMMTPYPGTKVYEIIKRQGRFLINDWEDYVFFEQKARYEMGEMTAELVEEMYRKAYRQYYLRPAPVMRRVKTKDFWLNLPRNVRIASRTFLPKKEKAGLRKAVEAEGAI